MASSPPPYAWVRIVRPIRARASLRRLVAAAVAGGALAFGPMWGIERPAPAAPEPVGLAEASRTTPAVVTRTDAEWIGPIVSRNVFDAARAVPADEDWAGWDDADEAIEVPWLLAGTMVAEPRTFSTALLIEDSEDGARRVIGLGDALGDGLIVVDISQDEIVVRREDGAEATLALAAWDALNAHQGPVEPTITRAGRLAWKVNDAALKPLYTNPGVALRGVRTKNGAAGVRLTRLVRSNTLYRLGLRKNDTIREVASVAVRDRKGLATALATLSRPSAFEIEITRRGKPYTLRYDVR